MNNIRILLTGDMHCNSELRAAKKYSGKYNFDTSFRKVDYILKDVDYAVGSVITSKKDKEIPAEFFESLENCGFNAVLHRNYAADPSQQDASGSEIVKHTLKGEYPSYECSMESVNGINVGIFTCELTNSFDSLANLNGAEKAIKEMRANGAEFIIGYVFWKIPFNHRLLEKQKTYASVLASLGVDYIAGTNAYYILPYDVMESTWGKSVPVAYSLGTFLDAGKSTNRSTSVGIFLDICKDDKNQITCKESYLPFFTFTMLEKYKYVTTPLNDTIYKMESLNANVDVRKSVSATFIGENIKLSHAYDVNVNPDAPKSSVDMKENDRWETEILIAPDSLQNDILDAYRLTDEYRDKFSEAVLADGGNPHLIAAAKASIKNYREGEPLDEEQERNLIKDLLYTRNVLGFKFFEYFSNGFEDLSILERTEFLAKDYRLNYYRRIQTNKAEIDHLDKKDTSYERLKKFYRRDMILVQKKSDFKVFKKFVEKHSKFISKPVNGTYGRGIEIVDTENIDDINKYFKELIASGTHVLEELIVSKEYLAAFHPNSVNSIRVISYNSGKDITCAFAFLRTGRGGSVVDNASAGGVFAAVDLETGEIISDGVDEKGKHYTEHPDSGIKFKGFKLQDVEGLVKTVKGAAKLYPDVKLIAWDVAHSEKGWQLIEGNSQGGINAWQFASRLGMRKKLEDTINFKKNIKS